MDGRCVAVRRPGAETDHEPGGDPVGPHQQGERGGELHGGAGAGRRQKRTHGRKAGRDRGAGDVAPMPAQIPLDEPGALAGGHDRAQRYACEQGAQRLFEVGWHVPLGVGALRGGRGRSSLFRTQNRRHAITRTGSDRHFRDEYAVGDVDSRDGSSDGDRAIGSGQMGAGPAQELHLLVDCARGGRPTVRRHAQAGGGELCRGGPCVAVVAVEDGETPAGHRRACAPEQRLVRGGQPAADLVDEVGSRRRPNRRPDVITQFDRPSCGELGQPQQGHRRR